MSVLIAVATLLVLWLLMQTTVAEGFSCYPGQRFENGVCVN
jgi:hypothetical protein